MAGFILVWTDPRQIEATVMKHAVVTTLALLTLTACATSSPSTSTTTASTASGTAAHVADTVHAKLGLDAAAAARVQGLVGRLVCDSLTEATPDPEFLTWLCASKTATVSVQAYKTRDAALANARGFLDQKLVAYIADDAPLVIGGKSADDVLAATRGSDAYSQGVLPDTTPSPVPATSSANQQMITQAEQAVKAELPDIPIWKGVTFTGVMLDEHTVCVDRTYPAGGGIDHQGGSAGYVTVTFPDKTLGEPQDGTCATATAPTPTNRAPVNVPADIQNAPGLVTRTDLGDTWPLTVDYAVLHCQPKQAGGINLQLATLTAPDGTEYALNGHAKSHTTAQDIEPIWAPDPSTGAKVDIGPLIERARALC